MLAQRDLERYTPPRRPLATLRRNLEEKLGCCPCYATRQRILLAVNEIFANVLRHAEPAALDIHVDFIGHDGQVYCVVRDDGGAFADFRHHWGLAAVGRPDEIFAGHHRGLKMIRRLWPQAFYIARSEAFAHNSFILPLTQHDTVNMPRFFLPEKWRDWPTLLAPLTHEKTL